tara:strand:+ start:11205 stop:11477 length:273 start_codon:yes stop_codon:yes gene_type:complete
MSDKKETLATTVDVKVRDYVEEVERVADIELSRVQNEMLGEIHKFKKAITGLEGRIAELEANQSRANSDDKYALTKAKLIRLMKDMGYYE